jgi:hypothetical protein
VNLLIPGAAPAVWFPAYTLPQAYADLTDELRPMLGHVWNHAVQDTDADAADALDTITRNPAMAWMAASTYATAACVNSLLPQRHYLLLDLPPAPGGLPRRQRQQVATTASGFLTAAARGHLAAPVPADHDHDMVVGLVDALLRAALTAHRTLRPPASVLPIPDTSAARRTLGPWVTYDAHGKARENPRNRATPRKRSAPPR